MLVSPFSLAEEVLYCVDELSTGTNQSDNGEWSEGSFPLKKRIVNFNDDRSSLKGLADDEIYTCSTVYLSVRLESLVCRSPNNTDTLLINMETMRYEFAIMSPFGYADDGFDNSGIFAGTCTTF
jgi:hypothetical protein